uniref:Uncharacterized protein n=1 Tax=Fagus sylvatica TaxID=28930 RepID=A0A2N9J5X5_FAGSY
MCALSPFSFSLSVHFLSRPTLARPARATLSHPVSRIPPFPPDVSRTLPIPLVSLAQHRPFWSLSSHLPISTVPTADLDAHTIFDLVLFSASSRRRSHLVLSVF